MSAESNAPVDGTPAVRVEKPYKLELSMEALGDDEREAGFKRATRTVTRPMVR